MFTKKSLESRSLGSATRIKERHINFNYLFYLFYLYLFITLEFLTSGEEKFSYESGRNFKRREGIEINEMVVFSSLPEVMKHISRYEPGFRMSRRRRNKQQKMINGNRRSLNKLTVLSQNIPQGTNKELVGTYLDILINTYKPAVLFINEVDADIVNASCPEGYTFLKGYIKDAKVIRLSAVVRKGLKVEQQEMSCEIPTLKLKTCGWTLVGFYREWRRGSRTECNVKEIVYCHNHLKSKIPPEIQKI